MAGPAGRWSSEMTISNPRIPFRRVTWLLQGPRLRVVWKPLLYRAGRRKIRGFPAGLLKAEGLFRLGRLIQPLNHQPESRMVGLFGRSGPTAGRNTDRSSGPRRPNGAAPGKEPSPLERSSGMNRIRKGKIRIPNIESRTAILNSPRGTLLRPAHDLNHAARSRLRLLPESKVASRSRKNGVRILRLEKLQSARLLLNASRLRRAKRLRVKRLRNGRSDRPRLRGRPIRRDN